MMKSTLSSGGFILFEAAANSASVFWHLDQGVFYKGLLMILGLVGACTAINRVAERLLVC